MHSPRWIEQKKKCLTLKPGALIANDKWLLFSMGFLVGFYRTFLLIFIWFSSHLFNQINAAFGQFWMNDVMREVSRLTNNFVEQRTKTLALSKKKICEHKTFLGAHSTQIQWLCSSNRISFYRRANIVAILMVACTCLWTAGADAGDGTLMLFVSYVNSSFHVLLHRCRRRSFACRTQLKC